MASVEKFDIPLVAEVSEFGVREITFELESTPQPYVGESGVYHIGDLRVYGESDGVDFGRLYGVRVQIKPDGSMGKTKLVSWGQYPESLNFSPMMSAYVQASIWNYLRGQHVRTFFPAIKVDRDLKSSSE